MVSSTKSRAVSARSVSEPMLMFLSNKDPKEDAVVLVQTGAGNATVRLVVDLRRTIRYGALRRIVLEIVTKVGGQPATIDFHLLDTDDIVTTVAELLRSGHVVYSNINNPISADPNELIIGDVRPEEIEFVTKGTVGKMQIIIVLAGGGIDGSTDYGIEAQIYGGARA